MPIPGAQPTSTAAAPAGLSAAERRVLAALNHPQRRQEWIAARRLAKSLARRTPIVGDDIADEALSLLPVDPTQSLRPRLLIGGSVAPVDVSLTHAGGWVAAAVSLGDRIGIDLVAPRDVPDRRLRPWLQPAERQLAREESLRFAELWAMKEAAYKATNENEPFRPADFPVVADRGWTCGGCSILLLPMGRLTLALATADPALFRDPTKFYFERRRV